MSIALIVYLSCGGTTLQPLGFKISQHSTPKALAIFTSVDSLGSLRCLTMS